MLRNIWKKEYTLRMYHRTGFVRGHAANDSYEDKAVLLDVQPANSSLQHTPEGDREVKSLSSYSNFPIQTASSIQGYRADLLWYDGEWYECVSCQGYEHLPIRHWNASWQRLSESDKEPAPNVARDEADEEEVDEEDYDD